MHCAENPDKDLESLELPELPDTSDWFETEEFDEEMQESLDLDGVPLESGLFAEDSFPSSQDETRQVSFGEFLRKTPPFGGALGQPPAVDIAGSASAAGATAPALGSASAASATAPALGSASATSANSVVSDDSEPEIVGSNIPGGIDSITAPKENEATIPCWECYIGRCVVCANATGQKQVHT